jgi:hypothetical protein
MQAPTFHLMARAMRQSYAARGAQRGAGNQPPASGIAHEGGQVRGLIGDITALHGKRQISAGLTCAPGDVRQPADGSPL